MKGTVGYQIPEDIRAALDTPCEQTPIANEGLEWVATIIRKNKDYGSSVWKSPVLAPHLEPKSAILVRMSDKVNRIRQLIASGTNNVKTESLDDSIRDLGAYCLLYLCCPDKEPA